MTAFWVLAVGDAPFSSLFAPRKTCLWRGKVFRLHPFVSMDALSKIPESHQIDAHFMRKKIQICRVKEKVREKIWGGTNNRFLSLSLSFFPLGDGRIENVDRLRIAV